MNSPIYLKKDYQLYRISLDLALGINTNLLNIEIISLEYYTIDSLKEKGAIEITKEEFYKELDFIKSKLKIR